MQRATRGAAAVAIFDGHSRLMSTHRELQRLAQHQPILIHNLPVATHGRTRAAWQSSTSGCRPWLPLSRDVFTEKGTDQSGNFVGRRLEEEVAAVEQVDLGVGKICGEGAGAGGPEDFIVTAPGRE